ncbi:MAG: nuclear transport factor 2 family protein [Steroidobacteraceae bacterium]
MKPIIRTALALACLAAGCDAIAQTAPASASAAAAPAVAPAPDLTARLARAANRIASIDAEANRIDDYNQLRNLQSIYGYYQDEALWDQVADLFADDATLEIGSNGIYIGRASIRRYFLGLTGGKQGLARGQLSIQSQLSPVITLAKDGRSAEARWRVLIQDATFGQSANWGSGVYENRYIKQDGVWKIHRLHLYLRFFAPYAGGWTHATAALNNRFGNSTAKADQPPGARYETWPVRQLAPMHYSKLSYGAYQLAPDDAAKASEPAAGTARTAANLEAQVRALELKLQRLRAVDEIENLQSSYGYYADMSMGDATSALFTENSTLEILGRGVFLGLDRIYEYMRRLGAPTAGRLFTHMQLQPVISVSADGMHANVRARLFEMYGLYNNQAQLAEGTYENRFVLENGVWKYQTLNAYQTFYTDYEQGWGKHSVPLMTYFPGYQPDLPHSVEYEPYPAVFVPPFHFRNPVSGR